MDVHAPTELFVYGTLRHDQPEHARYCRGVTGWREARLRGRLVRIVEGYLLLVVPPAAVLHRATADAAADEARRRALDPTALAHAAQALERAGISWIRGELLAFADAGVAWPPLDRWEGASLDGRGVYARVVVPVWCGHERSAPAAAWVYAATQAPAGAVDVAPGSGLEPG